MTIDFITKDVTTVNNGVVAHGCNCQGKMGAGIALAIKKKWPAAYYEYVDMVTRSGKHRGSLLGECQLVEVEQDIFSRVIVANCFTQMYYGREVGIRYADPTAIQQSISQAIAGCRLYDLPLYMPRIGCSLGGLNWDNDVFPLVLELDRKFPSISILICDT